MFNHVFLSDKFVWISSIFLPKRNEITYFNTHQIYIHPKKDLAKLKQYYGSKIVHLLQDNEIKESSPKALKDAKTWELPGAPPLDPTKGPKAGPWTPPMSARATRLVGTTYFAPSATSTSYATAPPVKAGAHNQSYISTGARKLPWFFPASPNFAMLESKLDSGNMDLWFKNQFLVHTDQIQVTWTSK